jgi:hypothetical protein
MRFDALTRKLAPMFTRIRNLHRAPSFISNLIFLETGNDFPSPVGRKMARVRAIRILRGWFSCVSFVAFGVRFFR